MRVGSAARGKHSIGGFIRTIETLQFCVGHGVF
jgi:hypothetical protein